MIAGHDAYTLIREMWDYSHLARTGKIDLIDMVDPTAPAVSQHHFHRRRQGDEKARVNRSAE